MSEDSTQLSVAELLARNGQGTPSSGGGRRRRGGRGIAVSDLTGDLPEEREGSSSHAAPDEPEQLPDYHLASGYETESPASGPINFYDPLAGDSGAAGEPAWAPSYEPDNFRSAPPASTRHAAPEAPANPFGAEPGPAPSGRRARREQREAAEREAAGASFGAPEAPVDPGPTGRRHRPEPDERRTMFVAPVQPDPGPPTMGWAPPPAPEPEVGRGQFGGGPGYAPPPNPTEVFGRNGAEGPARNGAPAPGGLPAWSARRRPPPPPPPPAPAPTPAPAPNSAPPDFDQHPEPVEDRSPGWSLAEHDQQLLSGQTVAGDLLRDAGDQDKRRGSGRDRGPRRGVIDLLDPAEARTEFYAPVEFDEPDDDYDDDELYDEDEEQPERSRRSLLDRVPLRGALPSRLLSNRLPAGDTNRRQWMILGGQAVGAAVAGMLLFKGFEKMWDVMPFLALVLAMVVILGLVALVRVLRRTDDIFSTVIAVVVGIFVTLGPLAFLLSTN